MFDVLMAIVAIVLFIPALVLMVQVLSACLIHATFSELTDQEITMAVLVPAHNESIGIVETLKCLKSQLGDQDQLLVVADNCTDDTADIARAEGAQVIVRTNESLRGKGYALDFGLQHLKQSPKSFDVLVIVDADCVIEGQDLIKLAQYTVAKKKPVQGLYLMYSKEKDSLKAKVAEFAWRVKNWVRPLGAAQLGMPSQLMGTGMAFPWGLIQHADLANGNIVEDMKLGIDFASLGYAPTFYPNAKIVSYFPVKAQTQQGQSKRWEHGHLSMILTEMPPLLLKGIKALNVKTIAMALDLSVPPLVLLVALLVCFALITNVLHLFFATANVAACLSIVSLLMVMVGVLSAWFRFGRDIISFKNLMFIPIYIFNKIPNHLSFFNKRQSTWNKTEREED